MGETLEESQAQSAHAALEGRGLSQRYGATYALKDVTIRLERGRVTALAGGNGAGKSTLIRLLTGMERASSGGFFRDGVPLTLNSRQDATKAGIFCVFQDQPFVPGFDVKQQMYLGYEHHFRRRGAVSDRAMRAACQGIFEELGLTGISPDQPMAQLSAAAREVVALAGVFAVGRLLDVEYPVILLDEPTSALSAEELEFLVGFINDLKARSAILFVSHRVSEVLQWSDAVYVLRDGANADYMTRETVSDERVHKAMGGQPGSLPAPGTVPGSLVRPAEAVSAPVPGVTPVDTGQAHPSAAMEIAGVRLHPRSRPFDVRVAPGEIVGLAGVEGSGKEELLRLCAGLGSDDAAGFTRLEVGGVQRQGRIREMLDARVVYLSGERQRDGIFGRLSISENMALSRRVASADRGVVVRQGREKERARALVKRLSVKTVGVNAPLASLSGGNQQKVLLGRCLELSPKVMLLDNVTRGVDIGAKATIYEVLRALASEGVAIVFAGDDLEELVGIADRLLVLKGGGVALEIANRNREVDQLDVLAAMV